MMDYGNEDGSSGLSSHLPFVFQLDSSHLLEDKSMQTAVLWEIKLLLQYSLMDVNLTASQVLGLSLQSVLVGHPFNFKLGEHRYLTKKAIMIVSFKATSPHNSLDNYQSSCP
jgi:hypothetical protein